jgi:hypothetical protein
VLPFLKNKQSSQADIIMKTRMPDGSQSLDEPKDDEDQGDMAMEAAAQDILRAIESKDATHLALALKSAFQIMDSAEDDESTETEGQE